MLVYQMVVLGWHGQMWHGQTQSYGVPSTASKVTKQGDDALTVPCCWETAGSPFFWRFWWDSVAPNTPQGEEIG